MSHSSRFPEVAILLLFIHTLASFFFIPLFMIKASAARRAYRWRHSSYIICCLDGNMNAIILDISNFKLDNAYSPS
jgi:hypothetical protein